MKKLFAMLSLLAMMLHCPTTAHSAVTFTADNEDGKTINYEVYSTDPAYVKVSSGSNLSGEVVIPDTVTDGTVKYAVKGAGHYAFDSTSITAVTLPKTFEFLESNSFYSCSGLLNLKILGTLKECPVDAFHSSSSKLYSIEGPQASEDHRCLVINGVLTLFAPVGIKEYTIPENVTSTYGNFQNLSSLKSITLPANLKVIGNRTFYNCDGLTSIVIPDKVVTISSYAFSGCANLIDVSFGASIKYINYEAFRDCNKLATAILPETIEEIGKGAFQGCSNLYEIKLGNNLKKIGESAFHGCSILQNPTLPQSLTEMGGYAFASCKQITEITLPDNLPEIPQYVFNSCTVLQSVKIGSGTKIINDYAFKNCENLSTVEFNDNLLTIKTYAFSNSGLKALTFPSKLTTIESNAFSGCTLLENVSFNDNLTTIGSYAFKNSAIKSLELPDNLISLGNYVFEDCQALKSVKFGSKITSIPSYAFKNCINLTSVEMGEMISTISKQAFLGCVNLENIVWSGSLTQIQSSAFENCKRLAELTLPASLQTIENYAFYNCNGVKSITLGPSVNSIGVGAFEYCSQVKSIVFPSSVLHLGSYLMYGCTSLETVDLPDNLVTVGGGLFGGCTRLERFNGKYATPDGRFFAFGHSLKGVASYGLTHITTPSSITYNGKTYDITSVGEGCFQSLSNITDIVVSEPVKYIGHGAFRHTDMYTVTLPNSVVKIYSYAFSDCLYMNSMTLGENVTHIYSDAFSGCISLEEIVLNKITPPVGGDSYFNSTTDEFVCTDYTYMASGTFKGINKQCILYVPKAGKNSYKSAKVWKDFTYIRAIPEPNRLEAATVYAAPASITALDVEMINQDEITAFQCDIVLPEGASVYKENGELVATLSGRASRTHNINPSYISANTVRIVSYSSVSRAFSGNSGSLFTLSLVAPGQRGTYPITITNIKLTMPDGQQIQPEDVELTMVVDTGTVGDANEDNAVNVTDLVFMTNYILGYSPNPFNFHNADVNEDGEINVTDMVGTVSIILKADETAQSPAGIRKLENTLETDTKVYADEFCVNSNNPEEVTISLSNPDYEITAFQFKMTLPEGVYVKSEGGDFYFDPASRLTRSHMIAASCFEDEYTVLCYSSNNSDIAGDNGPVIIMTVEADNEFKEGYLTIHDAIVTEANGTQHKLASTATRISDCPTQIVIPLDDEEDVEYINLNGQSVKAPLAPGLYIRRTNSSTTKILVK